MTRRVAVFAAFLTITAVMVAPTATLAEVASETSVPAPGWDREPIARSRPTQTDAIAGLGSPNDGVPWGLDRLDQRGPIDALAANRSYTYSTTGAGVKVYVVDSGVQGSHVDFGGRVIDGWSYRAQNLPLLTYRNERDAWDNDPNPDPNEREGIPPCPLSYSLGGVNYDRQFDPLTFDAPLSVDASDKGATDNDGHGTHVAGTIAGAKAGVAKGATIVPVRVLDSCGVGTGTMIIEGLRWILAQHQPGDKSVVNLSLGFNVSVPEVDAVIAQMIAEGILIVAAAGNSATTSCGTTPAATPGTFSIGASWSESVPGGFRDREVSFSNYGDCVDMFAPGTYIASTWAPLKRSDGTGGVITSPYAVISGTSMAAPHVAGALARYLQTLNLTSASASQVNADAWKWLRVQATCDAVTYWSTSRTSQTPNRMLAVDAPVRTPCQPRNITTTATVSTLTATWDDPIAFNGDFTNYVATLSPTNQTCVTSTNSCTFTGLSAESVYSVSVIATNTAGTSGVNSGAGLTQNLVISELSVIPGDRSAEVRWAGTTEEGTYFSAEASPGAARCESTSTSCVITGLMNNEVYQVRLTAVNGSNTTSVDGTVIPNGAPLVPSTIRTSTRLGQVTLRWSPVNDSAEVVYEVSSRDGRYSCVTTATSCVIRDLPNGKARSLYMRTSTANGGVSLTETKVLVWAGFKVRRTTLGRSTKPRLTSIVAPVSRGRRSWTSSKSCRVVGSRLVTRRTRGTCYLTLRVARYKSQPAMSVRVKLAIR